MHAKTLVTTLHLSSVEELPSAQQRIYVLSVAQMSINDVDEVAKATDDKLIEKLHDDDDINHFQASKRLSFPISIPADTTTNNDNDDIHDAPPIILKRLIDALHCGNNHKLILRKWKQGARWWNLNRNHTTDASSSSTTTTNNNGNSNINNTLSMAKAEVAGYRLAKVAMNHHSEKQQRNKTKKNMICAYVPDVLYFSHDEHNTVDTDGDPWALFCYFGNSNNNNTEELDKEDGNEETYTSINIENNSTVKLDLKNAIAVMKTPPHPTHLIECNHYPTTMTKTRHEFGFEEPHPRHGRVPIDECLDYAHMILRDVVLPIQFSFFEWSSSSSSAIQPSLNGVDWKHNLHALAIDNSQSSCKPFQYQDMIAVYKLALQRLSVARQTATVVVDDERMDVLLRMMHECVTALEHEWEDQDDGCCHPPPLPAVICHMDLQPQNLTFWHDSEKVNVVNTIHVAKHCSVASVMDFEEAAYADPRFEILLMCRKVLANLEQAEELWKSYSSSVKLHTMWDVGPIEPWLRLETVHSLFTLLLQANNLLGGGRNPWETKPDLWGKIDRERLRLVKMGWSFCKNKSGINS